MNNSDAYDLMKQFETMLGQVELLETMLSDEIDDVIGEEGLLEIEGLKARYDEKISPMRKEMRGIEAEVRSYVIETQKPLRGKVKQVIYTRPKVVVDTKGLLGYAVANPDVGEFISYSDPGTQIRKVGV